jgi:subtilisin family serine protease
VVFLDVGAFADGCTGAYTVGATDLNPTPPVITNGFSSLDGYGEVNAARAFEPLVSHPISRVATLGGPSWSLDRLDAPSVWAAGITGVGVTVAIVDSGMDMDHSELDAAVWTNPRELAGNGIDDDGNGFIDDVHGWDFVDSDADPTDQNGHGTFVAGIIAADNNGVGPTGVAYGATIMPIRVLDGSGSGNYTTMIRGIRYATANGARVINLSMGGRQASAELQAAIRDAEDAGVLMVMAGNNGSAVPSFPAAYAGQLGLAVGAIDATGTLAGFSNRAGDVTINYVSAPGVSVVSTILDNQTATWTGTSMAAAHVAGVAALLLSIRPGLTPRELVALVVGSARHGVAEPLTGPSRIQTNLA